MKVRLSWVRRLVVIGLTITTVAYLAIMTKNITPHGADKSRWETPATFINSVSTPGSGGEVLP